MTNRWNFNGYGNALPRAPGRLEGNSQQQRWAPTGLIPGQHRASHGLGPKGPYPRWRVARHPWAPQAPFPMCFTPAALEALLDSVGRYPAETGAKGFGPKDRIGFDVIEFDDGGSRQAQGAMYSPDVPWGEDRCQHHLEQPDDAVRLWTGDLHSHPGHAARPSVKVGEALGDLGYVEAVFAANEAMECFFIPILTGGATGDVLIHPWMCHRSEPFRPFIAELSVRAADEFPERPFNPQWLVSIDLAASAEQRQEAPSGIQKGAQVPDCAAAAQDGESVEEEYVERLGGILSPSFRGKTILTIGVGAGSYAVEKLARLMPLRLRNCDFDVVEVSNLARTNFCFDDAKKARTKVLALERRLRAINPLVEVDSVCADILEMNGVELDELFEGVDLVIAGTDQFLAQALINTEATSRGVPAVFVGIHAGGQGGRLVWTVPGETGCYRCHSEQRYQTATERPAELDLHGSPGSLIACQFIDMVAMQICLAILERGGDSQMARFYDRMRGRSEVVVRTHPDYEWGNALWDAMLNDLPNRPTDFAAELKDNALFAMDTMWLRGPRNPLCPDCGPSAREGSPE